MTTLILQGGYSQTSDLAGPAEFDRLTGVPQSLVHVSFPMQSGAQYTAFPVVLLSALWVRSQIAMITWGTWDYSTGHAWAWADIVSGKYDAYLHQWASAAASWKHPFMVRLDHEINLPAQTNLPYTGLAVADPAGYLAAWKHIVDLFRSDGATNVTWVWNINSVTPAGMGKSTDADRVAALYPGDSYVGWTSFDAYNWAGSKQGMPWLSWQQIVSGYSNWIGDTVGALLNVAPTKPILVGELGCHTTGGPTGKVVNGDKTAWIADMLKTTPQQYPRIGALSWFQRSYAPTGPNWALDGYDGTAWGSAVKAGGYAIPGTYPMPPDLQPILPLTTTTTWGDPYAVLSAQVTTAQAAQGTAEDSQTALEGLVRARKAAQGAEDAAVN